MLDSSESYEKLKRIGIKELNKLHFVCIQYGKTYDKGIRDEATLENIVFKIHRHAGKRSSPITIAAEAIHDIIKNHPFWDGNHRTAFEIARLILVIFGSRLDVAPKEAERFMRDIDKKNLPLKEIEKWLRDNIKLLR